MKMVTPNRNLGADVENGCRDTEINADTSSQLVIQPTAVKSPLFGTLTEKDLGQPGIQSGVVEFTSAVLAGKPKVLVGEVNRIDSKADSMEIKESKRMQNVRPNTTSIKITKESPVITFTPALLSLQSPTSIASTSPLSDTSRASRLTFIFSNDETSSPIAPKENGIREEEPKGHQDNKILETKNVVTNQRSSVAATTVHETTSVASTKTSEHDMNTIQTHSSNTSTTSSTTSSFRSRLNPKVAAFKPSPEAQLHAVTSMQSSPQMQYQQQNAHPQHPHAMQSMYYPYQQPFAHQSQAQSQQMMYGQQYPQQGQQPHMQAYQQQQHPQYPSGPYPQTAFGHPHPQMNMNVVNPYMMMAPADGFVPMIPTGIPPYGAPSTQHYTPGTGSPPIIPPALASPQQAAQQFPLPQMFYPPQQTQTFGATIPTSIPVAETIAQVIPSPQNTVEVERIPMQSYSIPEATDSMQRLSLGETQNVATEGESEISSELPIVEGHMDMVPEPVVETAQIQMTTEEEKQVSVAEVFEPETNVEVEQVKSEEETIMEAPRISAIEETPKQTISAHAEILPPPVTVATETLSKLAETSSETQAPIATTSEFMTPTSTTPSRQAPSSWAALVKNNQTSSPKSTLAFSVSPSTSRSPNNADVIATSSIKALCSLPPHFARTVIIPRGLSNPGNQCFMNVVLQSLLYCAPFYNYFRAFKRCTFQPLSVSKPPSLPLHEAVAKFLSEFEIISDAVYSNGINARRASTNDAPASSGAMNKAEDESLGEPFSPEYVLDALRATKGLTTTSKGRQEDAEEYLGYLLDGLNDELIKAVQSDSELSPLSPAPSSKEDGDWVEVGKGSKTVVTRNVEVKETPITRIFGGRLKSTFKTQGQKDSSSVEPFVALQIDITDDSVNDMKTAMEKLTSPEIIEYERNGATIQTIKSTAIEKLPPILILHLKRFVYADGETRKVGKHIPLTPTLTIPTSCLSATSRLEMHNRDLLTSEGVKYRLRSVVSHHGRQAAGGHYTIDCQTATGRWLRIDDTEVTDVSEEQVTASDSKGIKGDPYLILYEIVTRETEAMERQWKNIWPSNKTIPIPNPSPSAARTTSLPNQPPEPSSNGLKASKFSNQPTSSSRQRSIDGQAGQKSVPGSLQASMSSVKSATSSVSTNSKSKSPARDGRSVSSTALSDKESDEWQQVSQQKRKTSSGTINQQRDGKKQSNQAGRGRQNR